MTRYTNLFTLEILHYYYHGNVCRDVIMQPTLETQLLLRRYGCLIKGLLNNLHVYYPEGLDLNKIKEENKDVKLEFICETSVPNFINITEMPIDGLGYFYFSNVSSNNEGLSLIPEFKSAENPSNKIAEVSIDLLKLLEDKKIGEVIYKIGFQARQIPWKYYIIDNSNQSFKSLKLKGEKSELFSGPSEVEIQIGKAQCFDSGENKFPLKEISEMQLGLVAEMEDGKEIDLINLPNPTDHALQMGKSALYAAIYIYI